MNTAISRWDVRVHPHTVDLLEGWRLRQNGRSRPYWWKITPLQAEKLVEHLCRIYNVHSPAIIRLNAPVCRAFGYLNHRSIKGLYIVSSEQIAVHARSHIKTVVHEFYHHLDTVTDGKYDSDDRRGGASSLAWKFADRWWARYLELRMHV